jgi:catechol 2,3-dioxygenase
MIHQDTNIGAVHLTVTDLPRSLNFYQEQLGFQLHSSAGSHAQLSAGGPPLLSLYENPAARSIPKRTGLYHFAILVPSRYHLAQSLQHMVETKTTLQGFADHLVSEAIYLADPDGNGIEVYRDRPRDTWEKSSGQLKMASDPLDIESLLGELGGQAETWQGLDPAAKIGHIHLHVSSIPAAEDFYHDVLGFDKMLRYGPSASFLSAGGYHHHLGVNTWNGVGVPPPPADAVGLRWYEIQLPNAGELEKVVDRVHKADVPLQEQEDGWLLHDPAGNGVFLKTMP